MLSSNDLAELIESTRDRVQYMGGDSPAAAGVVQVLNGMITMLRNEVQEQPRESETSESAQSAPAEYVEPSAGEEPESRSDSGEQLPGYLQHLRSQRRAGGSRRRPVRESYSPPKPANPLSSPQYSGFFNALIAQQKSPESRPPAQDENGSADEAPPESGPEANEQSSDEPPRTFRDETSTG